MDMEKLKKHYSSLLDSVEYHNYRYYEKNDPVISDVEYDKLYRELKSMEEKYPELLGGVTPTTYVGSGDADYVNKKQHYYRMYSLDNVFSREELSEWIAKTCGKIKQEFPHLAEQCTVIAEGKYDGLSFEVCYRDGVLEDIITRGGGLVGDSILRHVSALKNIPRETPIKETFIAKGEILFSTAGFVEYNQQREESSGKKYKSPRNSAAGLISQKEPLTGVELDTIIHGVSEPQSIVDMEIGKRVEYLADAGFRYSPTVFKLPLLHISDNPTMVKYLHETLLLLSNRKRFPEFPLDGGVVKIEGPKEVIKSLGYTAKSPRFEIAYKFEDETYITQLLNVNYQVGRTGSITPVGELAPVDVGSAVIKYATLHNKKIIRSLDIRVNDYVEIVRSGDVIPKIVRVVKERRTGNEEKLIFPITCPACGGELDKSYVVYRCVNEGCPAQQESRTQHFFSKDGIDAKGVGSKNVASIIDHLGLSDPLEFFDLDAETLTTFASFGEKSANNFVNSLQRAKNECTLEKLISAFGIRYCGQVTSRLLTQHCRDLDEVSRFVMSDDILYIKGFGDISVSGLRNFFSGEYGKSLVEKCREKGLWPEVSDPKTGPLSGEVICITGKHPWKKKDLQDHIRNAGGYVSPSVTNTTTLLISPEGSSSAKTKKAEKLSIPIRSADSLMERLNLI